ncbi:MAG: hypothetical protein AB2541_14090, partial [Candidatus Thiodiazotropha sp.]
GDLTPQTALIKKYSHNKTQHSVSYCNNTTRFHDAVRFSAVKHASSPATVSYCNTAASQK